MSCTEGFSYDDLERPDLVFGEYIGTDPRPWLEKRYRDQKIEIDDENKVYADSRLVGSLGKTSRFEIDRGSCSSQC